jgi:hypothetical protein
MSKFLREILGCRAHLEQQFLYWAADADLPALVPEVPLDLPADARASISGQAVPGCGV